MGQVTKDQIERARQVDVLDYILACEPDNVKRVGNEYRLKDHESLAFNEKGFYWHSQGFGAVTALDYLVKVRELKFTEAVEKLCGYSNSPISLQGKSKLPDRSNLSLPLRNKDNRRVIEYLQSRGIDKPLILDCISRGDLYESLYRHDCVFTGRDENGKIRSATIRGTIGNFKRDTSGSDKKYGFTIPPDSNNADIAMIFESLIDALSHQTLYPEFDGWRLSLGGTSLAALEYFLEQHSEVKRCIVCTDNDGAGNFAAVKISELPGISVTRELPELGKKDWNETLQFIKYQKEADFMEYKRELSMIEPPKQRSLHDKLEKAKEKAAQQNTHSAGAKQQDRSGPEV